MSRIEQVMHELSDLRDFYLKLQRRHSGTACADSSSEKIKEKIKDTHSLGPKTKAFGYRVKFRSGVLTKTAHDETRFNPAH